MSKFEKTIQQVFNEVCIQALQDGNYNFGICSSLRRPQNSPQYQPGWFYNQLPQEVKDRIKNELRPEHAQNLLRQVKEWGQHEPWWERDAKSGERMLTHEKLKFEFEVLKLRPIPPYYQKNRNVQYDWEACCGRWDFLDD